jgi:hypothetical protein
VTKRDPITNPNLEDCSEKYWEQVLESFGLGLNRGHRPGKASLRGGINELVKIEELQYEHETGKVKPQGRGPDA